MVTGAREVVLIVEGGGTERADLKVECRRAFRLLIERAGAKSQMPSILAAGGRGRAYDLFKSRFTDFLDRGGPLPLLLVDSEAAVTVSSSWEHVHRRRGDGWQRPDGADDSHLHLMVECMEAWFIADRAALKSFFGKGFRESALPPPSTKIESVPKPRLYDALAQASRDTTAGVYGKGAHSFKLLATLDPAKVRAASPWADRFFAVVTGVTEARRR